MTRDKQFVVDVLEELFQRGLEIPREADLTSYLRSEFDDSDWKPTEDELICACVRKFKLTNFDPELECYISNTAGAGREWLAIHEAGHAIVGLELEFLLTGVRFFPDHLEGPKGISIFHNPTGNDRCLILGLIAVDVAGNIAQLITPKCDEPNGGRLSELCEGFSLERVYPSDFFCANKNADKIMKPIRGCMDQISIELQLRKRKPLFQQAEKLAEEILKSRCRFVRPLAEQLMSGPMTGTEIKRVISGK